MKCPNRDTSLCYTFGLWRRIITSTNRRYSSKQVWVILGYRPRAASTHAESGQIDPVFIDTQRGLHMLDHFHDIPNGPGLIACFQLRRNYYEWKVGARLNMFRWTMLQESAGTTFQCNYVGRVRTPFINAVKKYKNRISFLIIFVPPRQILEVSDGCPRSSSELLLGNRLNTKRNQNC